MSLSSVRAWIFISVLAIAAWEFSGTLYRLWRGPAPMQAEFLDGYTMDVDKFNSLFGTMFDKEQWADPNFLRSTQLWNQLYWKFLDERQKCE